MEQGEQNVFFRKRNGEYHTLFQDPLNQLSKFALVK